MFRDIILNWEIPPDMAYVTLSHAPLATTEHDVILTGKRVL
jgi:hypothetical protein